MPTPRDGRRTPAPCTHTKRAPAPTHLLSFFGNSSYHIYGGAIAANNATGNAGIVGFATGSTTYKFASVFARVTLGKGVLAGDSFYNTLPNNTQNQYLIGFTKPIRTGAVWFWRLSCDGPGRVAGPGRPPSTDRAMPDACTPSINAPSARPRLAAPRPTPIRRPPTHPPLPRTGDYSAACIDPVTNDFWGASGQGQKCARGVPRRRVKGFMRPRASNQRPLPPFPASPPATPLHRPTTGALSSGGPPWGEVAATSAPSWPLRSGRARAPQLRGTGGWRLAALAERAARLGRLIHLGVAIRPSKHAQLPPLASRALVPLTRWRCTPWGWGGGRPANKLMVSKGNLVEGVGGRRAGPTRMAAACPRGGGLQTNARAGLAVTRRQRLHQRQCDQPHPRSPACLRWPTVVPAQARELFPVAGTMCLPQAPVAPLVSWRKAGGCVNGRAGGRVGHSVQAPGLLSNCRRRASPAEQHRTSGEAPAPERRRWPGWYSNMRRPARSRARGGRRAVRSMRRRRQPTRPSEAAPAAGGIGTVAVAIAAHWSPAP